MSTIPSGPTTAREALELAWELAHPVREGQVIPQGTRLLRFNDSGVKSHTALSNYTITPEGAPTVRTLDPLPEPEPKPDGLTAAARHWANLLGVTPLYPKEDA